MTGARRIFPTTKSLEAVEERQESSEQRREAMAVIGACKGGRGKASTAASIGYGILKMFPGCRILKMFPVCQILKMFHVSQNTSSTTPAWSWPGRSHPAAPSRPPSSPPPLPVSPPLGLGRWHQRSMIGRKGGRKCEQGGRGCLQGGRRRQLGGRSCWKRSKLAARCWEFRRGKLGFS